MKFADSAAGAAAMKYARCNCVTARVDELIFHLPILSARWLPARQLWIM